MRMLPIKISALPSVALVLVAAGLLLLNPAAASDLAWTRSGPEGGQVRSVSVHPDDPSVVFAGTVDGVYRSTDGGLTWLRSNTGIGNRTARTIIINPQRPEQMFAMVWYDAELFRSDNGGETWHSLGFWENHNSASLQFSPTPFVLFLGVDGAVFTSTDSGTSWAEITNIPDEAGGFTVHPDQPEFMAVILSTGGVALSEDGGESWADCGEATTAAMRRVIFDATYPNVLYGQTLEVLYQSANGCRSWTSFPEPRFNPLGFLVSDPHRPFTLYASVWWEVLISRNGGRDWSRFGPVADPLRSHYMAFSPTSPNVSYIAAEAMDARRGVFRSNDGGVLWPIDMASMYANSISGLAVNPIDSTTVYAGANRYGTYSGNGVFKTSDSGNTWAFLEGTEGAGPVIAVDPISPEIVYATTADWGILKSTDAGQTWFEVWQGWGDKRIGGIEVDHHRAGTLFVVKEEHDHALYRSDDGGETWVKLSLPNVSEVYRIDPHPGIPGVVFASTEQALFRSTDWGESWVHASAGLETPVDCRPWWCGDFHGVTDLVFDPADNDVLYAGTEVGPYRSTNGGLTWEVVREGMLICCEGQVWSEECDARLKTFRPPTCEGWPNGLAVDPDRPSTVYATTSLGTYRSYNRGTRWELITDPEDLNAKSIYALGDGLLMGNSNSAGVLRLRVPPIPSPRRPGHRASPQGSSTPKAKADQIQD